MLCRYNSSNVEIHFFFKKILPIYAKVSITSTFFSQFSVSRIKCFTVSLDVYLIPVGRLVRDFLLLIKKDNSL